MNQYEAAAQIADQIPDKYTNYMLIALYLLIMLLCFYLFYKSLNFFENI
jgi:hypothetical protein